MSRGVKVWNRLSAKYDKLWVQKYSLNPTRRKVTEIIKSIDKETSFSILDVGCGTGQFLNEIKTLYPEAITYGIDYSQGMLGEAIKKNKHTYFLKGDICSSLPENFINQNSIDIVTCMHSFPYYNDKVRALKNIRAFLKPSGYAIFVSASINNVYDKFVMWFIEKTASDAVYLSKKDMRKLLKEEFNIVDEFVIKERIFMPTIWGFVVKK